MLKTIGILLGAVVTLFLVLILPWWIAFYVDAKRFANDFDEDKENHYTIRPPSYLTYLGAGCGLLFFVVFFIATFVSKEQIGVFFLLFSVAGGYLALFASRWKIEVRGHKLLVYQLGKSPREVDINNLDRIVVAFEAQQGTLTGYQNGKKLFKVESLMIGYDKLREYFQDRDMITSSPELEKNAFHISRGIVEKIIAVCTMVFGFGIVLYGVLSDNPTATPLALTFFALMGFAGLYLLITTLRWKIVVDENTFTYCTALGQETSLQMQDIERVEVQKNGLALIHNGKTIIKVEPSLKDFATLIERLKSENIPFYLKNEQIDYKY